VEQICLESGMEERGSDGSKKSSQTWPLVTLQ